MGGELLTTFSSEHWEQIFCLPFKCTIESRLQSFQFKILHRVAAHNYLLQKFGIVDSVSCSYCNSVETLEHKYYECPQILNFWHELTNWWEQILNKKISLSKDCIWAIFIK